MLDAQDPEIVPRNWRELIDRNRLDLGDAFDCVLGQIARYNQLGVVSYGEMLQVLDIGYPEAITYGFTSSGEILHDFGVLTLAWERYLDECLAG